MGWAAYHRNLLSQSSGGWKSESLVLTALISLRAVREGSVPGFAWLIDGWLFRVCSHHVPSMCIGLHVQISPFYNNGSYIGLGAHHTPLWVSQLAQRVKNLPVMQKNQAWSLSWEEHLEKSMATDTQYSCLENCMERGAWWATLLSMGSQRVRHSGTTNTHTTPLWPHRNIYNNSIPK